MNRRTRRRRSANKQQSFKTQSTARSSSSKRRNDEGAQETVVASENESSTSKRAKEDCSAERIPEDCAVNKLQTREPVVDFATSQFDEIKEVDHFVDKTRFIYVLLHDSPNVLITAPRAFGKSVNLSTVKLFVEPIIHKENGPDIGKMIPVTAENDHIFHDKKLWIYKCDCIGQECTSNKPVCDRRKFFYEHRGKYPVIYVNFQCVNGDSYEKILVSFKVAIAEAFVEHKYLLKCPNLWNADKEEFKKYLHPKLASKTEMENDVITALKFLSEVLDAQFGCGQCNSRCIHGKKRVYVLVDEFDAPIKSSIFEENVNTEMVNTLMTNMFKNLCKDTTHVERVFLTGYSFIAPTGLSGLRNFQKYFFLAGNERYVEFFGFTSEEIQTLVDNFKRNFWNGQEVLSFSEIQTYYNGYESLKSKKKVYSIWSVLHALSKKKVGSYWERSRVMEGAIKATNVPIIRYAFEKLCQGNKLRCVISSDMHLNHILELKNLILNYDSPKNKVLTKYDTFLSFLFQQGYLTISAIPNGKQDEYEVKAPNQDVIADLKKLLEEQYGPNFDKIVEPAVVLFNEMENNLTKDHMKRLSVQLSSVFKHLTKNIRELNEDAYHSMLFNILCKTRYLISTDLQGSTGRIDLVFYSDTFVVVIEVKYLNTAEAAIQQANNNSYKNIAKYKLKLSSEKAVVMGLNIDDQNGVQIRCDLHKKDRKKITIV